MDSPPAPGGAQHAVKPAGAPPSLEIEASGVARVRLHRPVHHNRLEPGDIDVLHGVFAEIGRDAAIRAVVLSAEGRTFCAGYDLSDLGTPGQDGSSGGSEAVGGIALLADLVDAVEHCHAPTVCALNGPVFGGGTDLALACDFRIGVAACRLMMPAGRFGLHYYHGGMRRYVERLGLGPAKRLFLLGETLDADAMLRIGFLDEVLADAAALDGRTAAIVETLLGASDPAVIASMKRCLNLIAAGEPDAAAADEGWARTRRSPDVGAAVARARRPKT